jgi:hypothetical protein
MKGQDFLEVQKCFPQISQNGAEKVEQLLFYLRQSAQSAGTSSCLTRICLLYKIEISSLLL